MGFMRDDPGHLGPRDTRAGDPIEDLCRACKAVRGHTVMAVDPEGRVVRVVCDHCGSAHNYRRGGEPPRTGPGRATERRPPDRAAFPAVSERERKGPTMSTDSGDVDLELLLRKVLREELGLTPTLPAEKWRGGELLLRPGTPGLQDKSWPIETFFHKIVMVRNWLRSLEQQINVSELPEDTKLRIQGHITGCYGSLTSLNVLFANEEDQFRGAGGSGS